MPEVAIIGAGITGLSCARFLRVPYVLLEKNDFLGGLCGSVVKDGFTFDYSGHFLHIKQNFTKQLFSELMGKRLSAIERNTFIRVFNKYVPFPFQANLYYLPEKIRHECLNTFVNRKSISSKIKEPLSFLDWSLVTFGKGITEHFMRPYNEKLWTISAKKLSSDWVAPFVPQPSISELKRGADHPQKKEYGYNKIFYYPKSGGAQDIINSLSNYVKISNNTSVVKVDHKKGFIETTFGQRINYKYLISTQPLPDLIDGLVNAPSAVKAAARKLEWNSVMCLNIGFKNRSKLVLGGKHWIYFPEKQYPFYRIGFYSNIAQGMAPSGHGSAYIEISHRPGQSQNISMMLNKVIPSLVKLNIIEKESDISTVAPLHMPYAYVIYDKDRQKTLNFLQAFLLKNNIYSIGRYGGWEYSFMEKSVIDALKTSSLINKAEKR